MLAKEARSRWPVEQLRLVEKKLYDAAKSFKMGPMPESPFGLTELGMADYRGATLAEPLRHLKVSNVDLSDVLFKEGASINESELKACRLDGIDMRNVFVRRSFSDCSFVKAKLSGARMGGEFVRCDFTGRIYPSHSPRTVSSRHPTSLVQHCPVCISSAARSRTVTSRTSSCSLDPSPAASSWAELRLTNWRAVSPKM